MEKEEAIKIAQEHITDFTRKNPIENIVFNFGEPSEMEDSWYFDYTYEQVIKTDEPIGFGGPPGFCIGKANGTITVQSWQAYNEL